MTAAHRFFPHAATVAVLGFLLALTLGACATKPVPVNKPCGVIEDDLKSVRAKTPNDQQRLDIHYERGREAGCWE